MPKAVAVGGYADIKAQGRGARTESEGEYFGRLVICLRTAPETYQVLISLLV